MDIESIRKQFEFDRVFNEGVRRNGKHTSIVYIDGKIVSRLGIVVNRKYGGAVQRNRIKRQIREAFKSIAAKLKQPLDVVIIPRRSASRVKVSDLANDLGLLLLGYRFSRT